MYTEFLSVLGFDFLDSFFEDLETVVEVTQTLSLMVANDTFYGTTYTELLCILTSESLTRMRSMHVVQQGL